MTILGLTDRIRLNGLVVCLCFSLASCGGSSDPEPEVPDPNPDPATGSEAPSADDEPITEDAAFNNAVGFDVVREPGPRLAEVDVDTGISEAEFALGLPESIVQVPADVDPEVNLPPFFEDLQNVTIDAGQVLEVVYAPRDPEGQLPGMFPEKLPQGATFEDNFDGSKTFSWQPLQADVGILRFTVTAIDPENSLYRVSQPILIKVEMPEDPSTIPNVAPMLDEIIPHTARVNDPVVFELKGIDLNGTVPTLEIPDLPAGASFNQDPRFEEIFVLRFVPETVGTVAIDVIARDSIDSSLTNTETIEITVLDNDDFGISGDPLRLLADARSIRVGFAALQSFYHRPDGALYASTAAREFNFVTPENSMKMDHLNPEPGRYQFAATDNLIAFAEANDMAVHGHPLVWHRQLPPWILESEVDNRETHMSEYIERVMQRYNNDIDVWDVVNEPMADDGQLRDSVWFEAMGANYIDNALTQARALAPEDVLLINEFDIGFAGPKFTGLLELIDDLKARDIPLDGIGFQLHLFSSYDEFDELRANFSAIASRDLDIYITELDVSLVDDATLDTQAAVYEEIAAICLRQLNCRSIQTWGVSDQYSFRSIFDPLLFDRSYQPKPAYDAVRNSLSE